MAHREHDGSEHAGTRAWDRGHDQDAAGDEAPGDRGQAPSPADQWFGDASPPPPPYAIDEGAVPPPPYAVGGMGGFGPDRPAPQAPADQPVPEHPAGPGGPGGAPAQDGLSGPAAPYGPPPAPQQSAAPGAYQPPGAPGAPQPQYDDGRNPAPAPDAYPSGPYQAGPYQPPAPPQDGPAPGPFPAGGGPDAPAPVPPPPPAAGDGDPARRDPAGPPPADPPGFHGGRPGEAYPAGPYPAPPPGPAQQPPASGRPVQDPNQAPRTAYNGQPIPAAPASDRPAPEAPDAAGMPGQRDGGASGGAGTVGPATGSPGQSAERDQRPEGTAPDRPAAGEAAPADPPPGQPSAPPWSNGAGGAPWTGGHSGFSQWAPPERAPSPPPGSRPEGGSADRNGAGPRPGEATEVIPPFRDEGEPAAGSWAYDPAAWDESSAEPPHPTGRGQPPAGDGPQWTSAEPVRPPEGAPGPHAAPGEPPLVGDGPATPPRVRPPEPPGGPAPSDGHPAPGGDVPSPERLPPLPPNAGPPHGGPGTGPGAGPPTAPPAWPPQHSGGPGGADTGGRPAPPAGDPRPESAPSGPQPWNAPPPAGPHQAQQQPYAPGAPDGGRFDPYSRPYEAYGRPVQQPGDPYARPGYDPYGAPPPPGAPEGYRPAPGPAPGGPPSGPQTGFQYSAHFADGVQPQQFPGHSGHPETAEDLRAENLVSDRRPGPSKGWRKMLHSATFGMVDVGESAAEQRRRELTERARTQVGGGHHRVAVLSLKGGVGKTTTTVALGSMLASLRGDRVLAVDANPDRGTLSDKVRLETAATIRDLLNERESISRYADIRAFTSQANSRLEILASDRDPAVSEAFSEEDYREVSWLLEHYYSICLTDCGTGLLHSAMRGVLGLADQIVLVSSASVDGARSASATLDWLEAHRYGSLVRGAVVVLSMVRTGKSSVDLERLEQHFASRCRAVARVPWDAHLEEGAEVDLERLAPITRDAYLQLAATVGEAFAWPR
ncbi:hypothetical protein GCM10009834_45410 [Streptomonospora arabica]